MALGDRGGRAGGRQGRGRGGRDSSSRGSGRDGRMGGRGSGFRPEKLPLNPSNVQFVRSVLRTCPNHKLKQAIDQLEKKWLSCWHQVESLPFDALKLLLSALARVPFSASIALPPLAAISKAVTVLLSQLTQGESDALDGNDDTLEGVELVERVVTRLLKFTWDLKQDDVKDALDEMIAEADSVLNIRLKTHRPVRNRLASLLSTLEKPWSIQVKVKESVEIEHVTLVDWRHPTVAWLTDYKHFQPALLPKLQLSRSNNGRVYESSSEYFATIVNLWIGMTFVEGNNALLPHCTVKVGDKLCDQPLWPFPGKHGSINCKNSQCDRYATFLCAHRQHLKGYCSKCAGEYQNRLRGPPSKYASTHIYDGVISQVKYDGTISIEHVASRRPPLAPIHWRTTKRLSSPNLVGVVRLANREASLRSSDEIYWGEIVFQGKSMDEYKAREQGRLTLQLLQYRDEPGNAMLAHNPTVGDPVAIIDCQAFVPEFIPVLKALEKQRQVPMPFHDGALLNLSEHASLRVDQDHVSVDAEEDNDEFESVDLMNISHHLSTVDLIRKVVQSSALDPIVDIRRDEALRGRLEASLLQLVNSATLDPGQLKSFAQAFVFPVHCTQGPPGTGKSYLGVIIVRALLIIRDLWKMKNREVGDPPILVLSYKNHAIDEFLLDLVRSEPTLDHVSRTTPYFGRYYLNNGFKKLVRIGGGCSEPELEQYRERNVALSDQTVRAVSKQVEDCQELREKWHKIRDYFAPIYEAHTMISKVKDVSPENKKKIYAAVLAASSTIALLLQLTQMINTDGEVISNVGRVDEQSSERSVEEDVEEDTSASPIEMVGAVLKKKHTLTRANILRLHDDIKHYDSEIKPQEVLYRWIIGFRPLPACKYAETCLKVCAEGSKCCPEHSCKFTQGGEHFCNDEVVSKRLYCKQHLCMATKCKKGRISESQSFCEDHACFVCLAREEVAKVSTDDPPRNTCEQHRLCWGLDGFCREVAEPNESNCKIHREELLCKWISQGAKCSGIASMGQYCRKHYDEAVALTATTEQMSTAKCQGRTRKGKACKGKALSGTNYCRDHVGRATLSPSKSTELAGPDKEVKPKKNAGKDETQNFHELTAKDVYPELDDPVNEVESKEDAGGHTQNLQKFAVEDVEDLKPEKHLEMLESSAEEETKAESAWSSDSDVDNFEDAIPFDNGDEVEESEHLQHLREVHEVGDDETEVIEIVEEVEDEEEFAWASSDQQFISPTEWHWGMNLEERWNALYSVLNLWSDINTRFQHAFSTELENLKMELQRQILRANSRVYEGKAVIGGTITGCVSRLEAIRTTNPFAILVEEASEVMEPLLVSCFGSSLRKLEMIGDHMQLQPSIMGRIDFERLNRVNISMFERLISAPPGNEVPASVLSVQRRMRRNICDLTRDFYKEIIAIEDHAICGTKVIGSQKRKVPLLDACEGGGREVPGVSPHIFFWTHSGVQERASVGLSRVNQLEAKMTCKLVDYLVHCGVPPKSIAVLTPYKGQLMLIRKILMNTYRLSIRTTGGESRLVPSCIVSTVDRFQGDEADVVIVSLVIDGKSRTPFVKLQNRMIVLLSRARLGLYVVGNVEYFGETSHWQRTLEFLKKDVESDNTKATDCRTYSGPRIGRQLPICCPEHRASTALAKNERDLKLGFCTVVCSVRLVCSHDCGLLCHWPEVNQHNKNCHVEVESPCRLHPRVLKCSVVTACVRGVSIDEALKKYLCDIQVEVTLPCGHNEKMKCSSYSAIQAGAAAWPVCNRDAVTPFVYPECKHIKKCTCNDFDRFSKGLAPLCTEEVEFTPPCQHTLTLSCHARQDFVTNVRGFVCKEKVRISLPRCSHEAVVSCPTAESLKQWTGEACTMECVQEGVKYGPKDHFCKQTVTFQRRCGHSEEVRCERAFELAQNPSRCQEAVVMTNPECGHNCSTTCYEEKRLENKVAQYCSDADDLEPLESVREGDASNYRNYGLSLRCSQEVTYVRRCGHSKKMKCSEARHMTAECREIVTTKLPTCMHVVHVACHLTKQLSAWRPWQERTQSIELLHDESVVVETLGMPSGACPPALKSILKDCQAPVRFRRTASCGHDLEMTCCDAFKILKGKKAPSPCHVRVLKSLKCEHEVAMKCCEDVANVRCQESVEKPCWNVQSCGAKVTVPCTMAATSVQCTTKTTWRCPRDHLFSLSLCRKGNPSDCPECSSSGLDAAIKDSQRILSSTKLHLGERAAARILPAMEGVTHIDMNPSSIRDFLIRKMKLLNRFKESLDSSALWTNPLFRPLEFFVFVVLNGKLRAQSIEKFEMKDFGSSHTFNGIEVIEATQANFKRVVCNERVSILFGHVYTVKQLVNPVDLPKSKGKNVRNWVTRQLSHGYDAFYREKTQGEVGSWIIWPPHAMFPVYRVDVNDSNRNKLLQCLPESTQVQQLPLKIRFNNPNSAETGEELKVVAVTPKPSIMSEKDLEQLRLLVRSVSPLFEKINVWHPWEGKSLSTGAADAIPQRTEKILASKLSFIPSRVAKMDKRQLSAFGGLKYIKMLQSSGKLKDVGDLFVALEELTVRKQSTADVRSKLEDYVTHVCEKEGGYVHPLVILAIARLAIRLSQTKASDVQRKLIELFALHYPEASGLWLDDAEERLIQPNREDLSSARSVSTVAMSVEDKWESLKSQHGCRSDAMEELLKLVGLKKVKLEAFNLFKGAIALQKLSPLQRKKNSMAFNYCFIGNPGTGKTTVARLFASVLKDSKIRRSNTFVECSAQKLKDDGAAEFRLKLQQASGGVIFIDEAYELNPAGDFKGKPIVAELLTAAEDKRDDLSIIIAGYEDDIQKNLYAYNDGLQSRFHEVVFEDFDAQELEIVWDGLAQDRGWKYEQAIAKVACRRLAKAAGRKGFGNARAVRKLFEHAVKAAMAREDFDKDLMFQTVDLLGERPSTNPKLQAILDEVELKTGWHKIKEEMKKVVRISDENYERELNGQETVQVFLNRLFLGNPGTGKTTCAGYYGRLLKALNFLSNGEVVKKTAGDFVGQYVGESQTKTNQILSAAKGKVLVIDEAYNLDDNLYGKQVLDVLVEKVQGTESDDLAVLLIGYEPQMLAMLRTQNPGLMRRFPPQYAFHFEDYTEHELLEILEYNCAKRSVVCPDEVAEALLKQLALLKTQPNFGNAGAVEQLLKHALGKAVNRPMVNGNTILTLEDVGVEGSSDMEAKQQKDPIDALNQLYRMDEIKEQLTQLRNQMIVADREGSALPEIGHFVFRGSPGTGKTTVARVMAEILHGMGVLATTKLVETSGLDLTGEHVGHTKAKVTEKLGEARGGLLFIDEAYELGKGQFGEEAMTTLVAAMTDPMYVGMVIVVAGYRKDMDQMLDRNVGLKSRFRRFIDFEDWEAQDAVVFLSEKAEAENFEVESEAVVVLQKTFVELKKLSNFGNGRDAVWMWKELLQCRAQRVVKEPEEERTITARDAEKAGEIVLVARKGCGVPGKHVAANENPMKLLDGLYRMDKIRTQLCRLQTEMAVAEREGTAQPDIGHFVFRGSPGTGKTTVARVMAQVLHGMGALGTTKLVETSGLDLTGEYLGQTKTKVTEKLVEAKGGLLFIDEAYELGKGHFGEEAMTTLVAAMTDPAYAGLVIVIAGYPKDMDIMLNRNAGLKSRFKRFIDFPDWEATDGVAFLRGKAETATMALEEGTEEVINRIFVELKKMDGFGNGRDAMRVWEEMLQCRAQRVFDSPETVRTIRMLDAEVAGENVLAARRPPDGPVLSQSVEHSDHFMLPPQMEVQKALPVQMETQDSVDMSLQQEERVENNQLVENWSEVEGEDDVEIEIDEKASSETRDVGVSDEDWEELERAKEEHAAHLKALQQARDRAQVEEERRRAAALQERIRQICPCPAGFKWYKCGAGWRCGGGSHFVSDAQLQKQFTC